MKYKTFILLPSYETNTYLAWDESSKEAMLIDPANISEKLVNFIKENELSLKYIFNTHGHADHIGGNGFFKKNFPEAKIAIHKNDSDLLVCSKQNLSEFIGNSIVSPESDIFLQDNDQFSLGNSIIQIIHTPGHTKGCISLHTDNLLFSGDTLFDHEIGRTDLPGGNYETLISSIKEKLFVLPGETVVLPGHGYSTTIATEKIENPYAGYASKF